MKHCPTTRELEQLLDEQLSDRNRGHLLSMSVRASHARLLWTH